jgi:hypothetical protein
LPAGRNPSSRQMARYLPAGSKGFLPVGEVHVPC